MERKYFIINTTLLVLFRFTDLYITHLVTPDLSLEMNTFVKYLNFDWIDIILLNIVVVLLGMYMMYIFYFKSKPYTFGKEVKKIFTIRHFLGMIYFNKKDEPLVSFLYKFPSNKRNVIKHILYLVPKTLIYLSVIATVNNLLIKYSIEYHSITGVIEDSHYYLYLQFIVAPICVIVAYVNLILIEYKNFLKRKEQLL